MKLLPRSAASTREYELREALIEAQVAVHTLAKNHVGLFEMCDRHFCVRARRLADPGRKAA